MKRKRKMKKQTTRKPRTGKFQLILDLMIKPAPGGVWYPEEIRDNNREARVAKRIQEGSGLLSVVRRKTYTSASGHKKLRIVIEPILMAN